MGRSNKFAATSGVCLIRSGTVGFQKKLQFAKKRLLNFLAALCPLPLALLEKLHTFRVNIYIICATKTYGYTPVAHHLAASGSGCILFSRHALLLLTASPPSRRMCAIQLWCLSQHIARRNGQCSMRARVCLLGGGRGRCWRALLPLLAGLLLLLLLLLLHLIIRIDLRKLIDTATLAHWAQDWLREELVGVLFDELLVRLAHLYGIGDKRCGVEARNNPGST